jgi:hypothetical protein
MRREVQLYIQDTRVDLFQDETISITDSIQNVSDISVVFTPFSKQFSLPNYLNIIITLTYKMALMQDLE